MTKPQTTKKYKKIQKNTKKYKKIQKNTKKYKKIQKNKGGKILGISFFKPKNEPIPQPKPIDEKTKFLNSLDEYKKDIDELNLSDVVDDDTSNQLKYHLKNSIANFYEDIKNKNLTDLNSSEVRAIAGVILTKTVILKLLAQCPDCPNLKIATDKKEQIVSMIEPILKKPYIAFTSFENAIKTA